MGFGMETFIEDIISMLIGYFAILGIFGIAYIVILIFVIRATCKYLARKIAEEIEKKQLLKTKE